MKIFDKLFSNFKKKTVSTVSTSEQKRLDKLSQKLNLKFNHSSLLLYGRALTHRSYIEKKTVLCKSNERLEFLGDAVLGVVVAKALFSRFPDEDEGFLTKTRSHIVDKNGLYDSAKQLELKDFVFYDRKFIKDSEEGIKTILADCMEALIAAIYLDQGIDSAEEFISKWIITPKLKSGKYQIDNNFKGQLLEYTHLKKISPPTYVLLNANGPDHKKEFIIEVQIDDKVYGKGKGKSKKSAEQEAAQQTLIILKA